MTERKLISDFVKATQGLAYWSRQFLKIEAAIKATTPRKAKIPRTKITPK